MTREERIREWATTRFRHVDAARAAGYRVAQADVLILLDTPEAAPPDAGATREKPTLRERFVMAAITGLLANSSDDHVDWHQVPEDIAARAIEYADETIRRLRREED